MILNSYDKAYYTGVLGCLARVAAHNQEELYREIVDRRDLDKLLAAATPGNKFIESGLVQYGYCTPEGKRLGRAR